MSSNRIVVEVFHANGRKTCGCGRFLELSPSNDHWGAINGELNGAEIVAIHTSAYSLRDCPCRCLYWVVGDSVSQSNNDSTTGYRLISSSRIRSCTWFLTLAIWRWRANRRRRYVGEGHDPASDMTSPDIHCDRKRPTPAFGGRDDALPVVGHLATETGRRLSRTA